MSITFDPSTVLNVTLSGGNLTGSNSSTANPTGCKGFAADAKSAGKLYFEMTGLNASGGSQMSVGINAQSTTYANQVTTGGGAGGVAIYQGSSGVIFANGSIAGSLGKTIVTADVLGIAVDIGNKLFWGIDLTQSGLWNNSGSANPATGVSGVVFISSAVVPFFGWGGGGSISQPMTLNLKGPFVGALPSGYSAWDTSVASFPYAQGRVIG